MELTKENRTTAKPGRDTPERIVQSDVLDQISKQRKNAYNANAMRKVIDVLDNSIAVLRPSTGTDLEELNELEKYLQTIPLTKRAGFLDSAMGSKKFASEEAQRQLTVMSDKLLPSSKRGLAQKHNLSNRADVSSDLEFLEDRDAALTRLREEKKLAEQTLYSMGAVERVSGNVRQQVMATLYSE